MDAAATIRTPLAQLARAALLTAIVGYAALAVSLLARRMAGGFEPLDAPPLLALAVSVPAAILLVRRLWLFPRELRPIDWFVRIAPSASALLLAAAVSLRGTSPPALAALWLAIVAVESTLISRTRWNRSRNHLPLPSPRAPRALSFTSTTTQSIVREATADGETITGELLGTFRAGERTIFLHVAFCPPLASVPTIECEQLAGPDVEIKVAQSQTYGARFDVRLTRDISESVQVQLQFVARCASSDV